MRLTRLYRHAFRKIGGISLDARKMNHRVVAMGTSAEGLIELKRLVEILPATLNAAIFVVVRSDAGESQLANIAGADMPLPADIARSAEPIIPGRIYVAPPDRHMLIQGDHIRLVHGPKENGARPAIDPLFRSAAFAYGARAIGVVLSGSLDDGSAGLLAIKDRGGIAVVQDPADAAAPSMPGSAAAHVAVDYCRPIRDIGPLISALAGDAAITPARNPPERPRERSTRCVELEHYISDAGVALTDRDWWNELVTLCGLTCPECQGVLGEVRDRRVLRFRCQTGHAYSVMTLLKALAATSEAAVSASLRALAQESELANRIAVQLGHAPEATALASLASSITSGVLELRTMLRSRLQRATFTSTSPPQAQMGSTDD